MYIIDHHWTVLPSGDARSTRHENVLEGRFDEHEKFW